MNPVSFYGHPEPWAESRLPQVVIVGGGFGGLAVARSLGRRGHRVTLIDRESHQLHQPLLYQVATDMLPATDITSSLRELLQAYPSVTVLKTEALDIDPLRQELRHAHGVLPYDQLVVATGLQTSYRGDARLAGLATGLKTLEDAIAIRERVLEAFERAERTGDPGERAQGLCFVVVGAGPNGIELAAGLAELAHRTLVGRYRRVEPRHAKVILVEASPCVLPDAPPALRAKACQYLEALGVTLCLGARVRAVDAGGLELEVNGRSHRLEADTTLWAAGACASGFGVRLAARCATATDPLGRLRVEPDGTVPGHPRITVIGDLAALKDAGGGWLPMRISAALQQGHYAGRRLHRLLAQRPAPAPFRFADPGSLLVVGTRRAIGHRRGRWLAGRTVWWLWILVQVFGLAQSRQRARVLLGWCWRCLSRRRTEPSPPARRLATGTLGR